jgi:hypothetical protein
MSREVLLSCLPWLALLVGLAVCLRVAVRLGGTSLDLRRLRTLHADQEGSVQTLSFVLTLPFFVMVLLLIVQVSQIMIGTIVVHYAAFASARSAIVWLPARLSSDLEEENCLSSCVVDSSAEDQRPPVLDPNQPGFGPAEGGMTYLVQPGSPKYGKIASAAVLACMPIAPSRDLGLSLPPQGAAGAAILTKAYQAMVPGSNNNPRVPRRLENKLAYALEHTDVAIRFFHPNSEPPLVTWYLPHDPQEFRFHEAGWQDPVTVTVTHEMALLPGPGRLLARKVKSPEGKPDEVAERIRQKGNVYVYPLTATATLGNEGEKSVIPYVYHVY